MIRLLEILGFVHDENGEKVRPGSVIVMLLLMLMFVGTSIYIFL
jgi:hypothetical protein